ncbi:GPP34 family phosphoprotein [Patulibacter sp.]|uniref:GOLPH3/VPS74 family protein n=1 Tax=Patulibacter sp. TaxID=1912859 RepID=UPI0027267C99|nr:GPP34 family phosphoprotein [Patulibacter sp.]MDO9407539.1 GPP34 family phosphoprotein [Patulibacter sp.]
MLIAEDLALLLHDDDSGKQLTTQYTVDVALAGAILLELALRGAVRITGTADAGPAGRVVADGEATTGDELLDDGLRTVRGAAGKTPDVVLEELRQGLRDRVLTRLVAAGELRREEHRTLGVFKRVRWPAGQGRREDDVRRDLDAALQQGREPDERTAAIVSLLSATDLVRRVVPTDDHKATKRRADEIAKGPWAADAVRQAVEDVASVVMTTSIMVAAGS